uniref:RRM domain-containing protein n=2 Tax=Timema TaxID=61471 RepID=A0A7R9HZN0_9NEOP|nr:unnamed protein product [Timema bartmani]
MQFLRMKVEEHVGTCIQGRSEEGAAGAAAPGAGLEGRHQDVDLKKCKIFGLGDTDSKFYYEYVTDEGQTFQARWRQPSGISVRYAQCFVPREGSRGGSKTTERERSRAENGLNGERNLRVNYYTVPRVCVEMGPTKLSGAQSRKRKKQQEADNIVQAKQWQKLGWVKKVDPSTTALPLQQGIESRPSTSTLLENENFTKLQHKDMTVDRAVSHLTGLKDALQDIRDTGIDVILDEASNICAATSLEIDCFFEKKRAKKRKRLTLEERTVWRRRKKSKLITMLMEPKNKLHKITLVEEAVDVVDAVLVVAEEVDEMTTEECVADRTNRRDTSRSILSNTRLSGVNSSMDNDQDIMMMGRGGSGGGGGSSGGGGRGGRGSRFRGGQGVSDDRGMRSQDDRLNERLAALAAPTHDLPPQDVSEKKFSGRCRLYIGNLTNDVTEEEMQQLFSPYGETSELFVNKEKNFAFIRMDYRASAEKAKRELDGSLRKGRPLKVRFAPHSAAVKVKNLTQWVTNELLERAFSVFGEIERAVIIVDERGKSQGEGIIEFARRPGAQMALRRCNEGCFFLTASLRPVVVEPFEQMDDVDGYAEKNLPKKNPDYYKAREHGPRFAVPGSFEHEYGSRWKQLYDLFKQKEEALGREMKMEEEKLEAQMEYARYEHETEILREQLRQRELDRERQKREWEMKERQAEEQRLADEERMRRSQEEMSLRMHHQEEELRRRQQENTLFMQAHQLSSLLDQQEQALRSNPTDELKEKRKLEEEKRQTANKFFTETNEWLHKALKKKNFQEEELPLQCWQFQLVNPRYITPPTPPPPAGLSVVPKISLPSLPSNQQRRATPYPQPAEPPYWRAAAGTIPPDPKAFLDQYDRNAGRYDAARGDMREDLGQTGNGPRGNVGSNPRGRWGQADRRADDYPSKRRRY